MIWKQRFLPRPLHTNRTFNNEDSLVILDQESAERTQLKEQSTEAPQEDIATDYETQFKTLHINRIWVSSKKNNEDTHFKTPATGTWCSREQHKHKLTPFKTPVHVPDGRMVNRKRFSQKQKRIDFFQDMHKSGGKITSFQDTVEKVSTKLIPFKTPDVKYRTSRVHFKTFDNWVKARKMKCDTALKDALSFVSEKEEDWPGVRQAPTRSYLSRRAQPAGGLRGMVTPRHPKCPP